MKKIFIFVGFVLILAGCTQQTISQNTNPPVANANTNKPTDAIYWELYQDNNFNVKYPAYLSQEIELDGVRTTVSFQGGIAQQNYESLLSIASMPNQGGLTLDDWTNEVISQSSWIKDGSIKISGQTAYILVLPETDAGRRYVFLSKNDMTIFDMTIQHLDPATVDLIISSFLLIK